MSSIGKLIIKNMVDGVESKGFMLLITYSVHKGDAPYSQALLSDGVDTVFALDNKLGEPNHKYPPQNSKAVVYVKLAKNGDSYAIENVLPADDPAIKGSCSLTPQDFVVSDETPAEKATPKIESIKMNEKTELLLLVTSVSSRKGNVKPYVEVIFSDGKTSITAKDFTRRAEDYQTGTVVNAEIKLDKYGYSVENVAKTDVSPAGFTKHPPVKEEEMYREITDVLQDLIDRNGENSIAAIGLGLYEKNKEKLLYWSASKSMHHDMAGGLLYHTFRMIRLAEKFLEVYTNLNEELLLTAVAIHDLGKLVELETDELGIAAYTNVGNLIGHTVIGIEMIEEESKNGNYDPEMVMLLKHCVGAHHGKLEFNAIVLPKIEEAFILHVIDYTDSRAYMFESAYSNIALGASAEKRDLGLETVIYRPSFATDDTDN